MDAPAVSQDALRQRILSALRASKKPVKFVDLAKLAKAKDEPFRAELAAAVDSRDVFRWPDRRRAQYFWHVSPQTMAKEAILDSAAARALSKAALTKAAAKKSLGLSARQVQQSLPDLIRDGQLKEVPAFASRSKLFIRPGGQQAYFDAARAFVEDKIRRAGFDPAAFFAQKSSPLANAEDPPADPSALIVDAVRSLEPCAGVPVSTLRLRSRLHGFTKHEFDKAALELREKQQVFLSEHADPGNLSQEDKDLLIDGQDGTYYVAIAIR